MRKEFLDLHTYVNGLMAMGTLKKVNYKPFMIVAGYHAMNDMAGDEANSWKSVLEKNGFEVVVVSTGLGENDDFAAIFVANIDDAAADAGISLK